MITHRLQIGKRKGLSNHLKKKADRDIGIETTRLNREIYFIGLKYRKQFDQIRDELQKVKETAESEPKLEIRDPGTRSDGGMEAWLDNYLGSKK